MLGSQTASVLSIRRLLPWLCRNGTPYLNDRGFVDFTPHDIDNPRNWPRHWKWLITAYVAAIAWSGSLTSSIPAGSIESISDEFGISKEIAGLTITMYLLGYCIGPLIFSPLSEFYGQQRIFQITVLSYMIFNLVSAFALNFATHLVGRLLAGISIASGLSNAPAVLTDMWDDMERGNAMVLYSLMVWAGPSVGPVISGFLDISKGWRWGLYVAVWFGGIVTLLLPTLPETNARAILARRASDIRRLKIKGFEDVVAEGEASTLPIKTIYKTSLTRPWKLFFDPISFFCCFYLSFVFTLQYMLFCIYPIVFQDIRGWKPGIAQLPLLGTTVGYVMGALFLLMDTIRRRKKLKMHKCLEPEDRLYASMFGGVLFAVSMFWFTWTAGNTSIHWMVPTVAGAVLASSLMLTFSAYLNYVIDSYTSYGAAAMAANTCARSIGSAVSPLYTNYMFKSLGVIGGGMLIAGLATILAIIPFLLYRYGGSVRGRSKWASGSCTVPEEKHISDSEASTPTTTTPTSATSTMTVEELLKSMEQSKRKVEFSVEHVELNRA